LRSEFVIVGGGAGGLELACKLGRKLGPSKVTQVSPVRLRPQCPGEARRGLGTLGLRRGYAQQQVERPGMARLFRQGAGQQRPRPRPLRP